MTAPEVPDIIIGVDLGTTFTGVAWTCPNRPHAPIQIVRDWPNGLGGEHKVPSLIRYNGQGDVASWGFGCERDPAANEDPPWSFFKLFINRQTLDEFHRGNLASETPIRTPPTHEHALSITVDYLRCVYDHLKDTISRQKGLGPPGKSWADMSVSFLFSVPTTWATPAIIQDYKVCIERAGFQNAECPRHTATVDLTEAEAAAVTVAKESLVQFDRDEVFLCVDAGGGTTDLALTKVASVSGDFVRIEQITAVSGIGNGSTQIDADFAGLVQSRINACGGVSCVPGLKADCAVRMARSRAFKVIKHGFGSPEWQEPHLIRVEDIGSQASQPGLGLVDGNIMFSDDEMRSLFRPPLEAICAKVKEHLDMMSNEESLRGIHIKRIVLSGGLGGSEYVRAELRRILRTVPHPHAQGAEILSCAEPQLVVVRGLVLNKQQDLLCQGSPVLASRIARASYGVVVALPVDAVANPRPEDIFTDPKAKKKWVKGQIHWLIGQGDSIEPGGRLRHELKVLLEEDKSKHNWTVDVVSHVGAGERPTSMKPGETVKLCVVKGNLTGLDHAIKINKTKPRFMSFRGSKRFSECVFDLLMFVGPADLTFELQVEGHRVSPGNTRVNVEWTK